MDLIVAVSSNWAIGKDNDLLFSLKTDMKYFRQNTLEKTVILVRKNPGFLPRRPTAAETREPGADPRSRLRTGRRRHLP